MTELIRRQAVLNTVIKMRHVCDTNDIDDYAKMLFAALGMLPSIDEHDVVAEYCQKRGLVIITADLFEKIKRESVRAAEQKLRGARNE